MNPYSPIIGFCDPKSLEDPKIGRGGEPIMGDCSDLPRPITTNFGINLRLTGSRGSSHNRPLRSHNRPHREFPIWPRRVAKRWEFRRLGTSWRPEFKVGPKSIEKDAQNHPKCSKNRVNYKPCLRQNEANKTTGHNAPKGAQNRPKCAQKSGGLHASTRP